MSKLTDERQIRNMMFLFTVVYMVSYITRINYGAIIAEMERETGMARSLLSLALTGSFITYGAGQIISGICGDKFSPKLLVSGGLILTILMNLLIPVCTNPYAMTTVWCVNGFAQAFMWPPLVRLMTLLFSDEDYSTATVRVSWGSSFGTIAVYLISPLMIALSGWRAMFVFSALCGIVMLVLWNRFCPDIKEEKKETAVEKSSGAGKNMLFSPLMIAIMVAIILQGALRDGVTTWMPSYIAETYNMSSVISILTGVILPLFSIACFQIASNLHRKKFTNPVKCAGVIFGAGAIAALALVFVTGKNAAASVFCSALLTGAMHGVNLMLICMVPAAFKKYGNVSTVSGVINSCTYIGSAISTYGIALISENFGWSFTLSVWLGIAAVGTAICLLCARPWSKTHE